MERIRVATVSGSPYRARHRRVEEPVSKFPVETDEFLIHRLDDSYILSTGGEVSLVGHEELLSYLEMFLSQGR